MPKKTTDLAVAEKPPKVAVTEPPVRIEERIEDFVELVMPTVKGTSKMEVKFLWGTKDGKQKFFRVNYWQFDPSSMVPVRKSIQSNFVRVDIEGSVKKLVIGG